jgi:AraC family transcriptional activator of pobA
MAAPLSSPDQRPPPPVGAMLVGSIIESAFVRRTWGIAGSGRAPRANAFLVQHGRAWYLGRDEAAIMLEAPFILWLPSSARGEFRLEAGGEGVALSILDDFLWRTVGDSGMAAHLRPLLARIAIGPADRIASRLAELETSFAALVRETREAQAGASVMMGLHLGIILVGLWRASGLASSDLTGAGAGTAQRFRQLVELHYREGADIASFARQLGVTRAHLHDACAKSLGATPLSLIHDRLVEEACRRLEQTQLSIEQIGYSLGFRDPAYFNRFFKRERGLAPGAYRRAARARAAAETPYAAWP